MGLLTKMGILNKQIDLNFWDFNFIDGHQFIIKRNVINDYNVGTVVDIVSSFGSCRTVGIVAVQHIRYCDIESEIKTQWHLSKDKDKDDEPRNTLNYMDARYKHFDTNEIVTLIWFRTTGTD